MAGTVHEVADVRAGDGDMALFTYRPEGDGKRPAVIVIQEIYGVNDHMKDVAGRFAAEGYFAAAPDLFHRSGRAITVSYSDNQQAFGLMGALSDDSLLADLNATVASLKSNPNVDGDNIGIVGFCYGGMVAYLAAAKVGGLSAAAVFYGFGILPPPDAGPDAPRLLDATAGDVAVPIISFWGDQDGFIPVSNADEIVATLKAKGKSIESTVYAGAGHGFFCDARDSYHEASAKDAWSKTLGFFAKHLKG